MIFDRINPSEIVASSEFHGASRIDMILRMEREDRLKVAGRSYYG